jgi:hypothetical protein
MTKMAADFVQEMRTLVHKAILDAGGRLEAQIAIVGQNKSRGTPHLGVSATV